jgi:two-component sensor histidine kinase
MLAAEMSHRVKNLFSVLDAMIHVSKRSASSAAEMATILSGRLHALAAAHTIVRPGFSSELNRSGPLTASLNAVVHAILKPYEAADFERFLAVGPEINLGSQAATSMALVFHELATNAAKYGALSREQGRVSVSWEKMGDVVTLHWQERGGPSIETEPNQQGFGSTLARDAIMRQLDGSASFDWQKQGLLARFVLPIAKLAS